MLNQVPEKRGFATVNNMIPWGPDPSLMEVHLSHVITNSELKGRTLSYYIVFTQWSQYSENYELSLLVYYNRIN